MAPCSAASKWPLTGHWQQRWHRTRAYGYAQHRGLIGCTCWPRDLRVGIHKTHGTVRARKRPDRPVDEYPAPAVEAALDARIEWGLASIHKRYGLSSFLNCHEPGGQWTGPVGRRRRGSSRSCRMCRDRPKHGGTMLQIKKKRRHQLMLPRSASSVPLTMVVRTSSIK